MNRILFLINLIGCSAIYVDVNPKQPFGPTDLAASSSAKRSCGREGGGCSWNELAELSWGDRDAVGAQEHLPGPGHISDWLLPTFLHTGLSSPLTVCFDNCSI